MTETDLESQYRMGRSKPGETCEQRNMRMGWGCRCHGETFCPDLVCIGLSEDDVPIFVRKDGRHD